jgi:vitamin B12 transporter
MLTAINRWSWYPVSKLTLRTGWDYRYNRLDSTDTGIHSRHDGGIYLTTEYKPHEKFLIIPSVKAVFSGPSAMPAVPVPKLGFLFKPSDSLTLKNNYYRSFKYPDFEDLYWGGNAQTRGNADLKPEDGWGGDISAAYIFKKWAALEGVFFTQWTKDSIHWSSGGGVWRPQNAGEAIFFGLDIKPRFDIPLSKGPFVKAGLSLSYQYLLSYLLSYGYTYASDKRIPYMPQHTIGASLELPWKISGYGGFLLISGHYESLRYADTANLTRLKPYFLLNANFNQRIGKNLTAFAIARNILNTSYESFADYPMPGITVTIGMKLNYEGLGVKNEE